MLSFVLLLKSIELFSHFAIDFISIELNELNKI